MSKKWSSYEKDGKIMESWRRYVDNNDRWATYLNESSATLTESEKNDLLQEIDFLKNLGARMRGGKQVRPRPNLTHGWEAAVAEFAAEDENAKRLAKSVGFDNISSEKEFLDKIRMTIAAAQKSGDPELGAAAQELAQDVEQAPQGAPADAEEEPEDESLSLKQLKQHDVRDAMAAIKGYGLSPEKIAKLIDDGFKKSQMQTGAMNPFEKQNREKQLPMINLVRDEIVKILSGDFSNLVRESQGSHYKVHPATYLFFQTIISNR